LLPLEQNLGASYSAYVTQPVGFWDTTASITLSAFKIGAIEVVAVPGMFSHWPKN
jgi:hypothetical protein